jgi:hypothetical protein
MAGDRSAKYWSERGAPSAIISRAGRTRSSLLGTDDRGNGAFFSSRAWTPKGGRRVSPQCGGTITRTMDPFREPREKRLVVETGRRMLFVHVFEN